MKIARVVLTATILFSLKSTLFCSDKQAEDTIQVTRKNSGIHHDGTRDGLFGSGLDTLKNIKDKKLYGGQSYGMGSDAAAISRWTPIIKTIKDLDLAQVVASEAKRLESYGLYFSEDAMKPSLDLIAAENQRLAAIQQAQIEQIAAEKQAQFEKANNNYFTLNQQSKALLCAHNIKIIKTRKEENKALVQKYADALKAEQTQLRDARKQEDRNLAAQLANIFDELANIKDSQNKNASHADHKITKLPFVESKDAINLLKLSQRYQAWNPKVTTYAQAVQNNK